MQPEFSLAQCENSEMPQKRRCASRPRNNVRLIRASAFDRPGRNRGRFVGRFVPPAAGRARRGESCAGRQNDLPPHRFAAVIAPTIPSVRRAAGRTRAADSCSHRRLSPDGPRSRHSRRKSRKLSDNGSSGTKTVLPRAHCRPVRTAAAVPKRSRCRISRTCGYRAVSSRATSSVWSVEASSTSRISKEPVKSGSTSRSRAI